MLADIFANEPDLVAICTGRGGARPRVEEDKEDAAPAAAESKADEDAQSKVQRVVIGSKVILVPKESAILPRGRSTSLDDDDVPETADAPPEDDELERKRLLEENQAHAVYLYSIAAEQGHRTAAQRLAERFMTGYGVKRNFPSAIYWLVKSGKPQQQAEQEVASFFTGEAEQGDPKVRGASLRALSPSLAHANARARAHSPPSRAGRAAARAHVH